MLDLIFQWVSSYGYVAIFGLLVLGIVGLPVPDETMLVFCGYLVWRGNLKAIPTLIAAFLGSVTGITISYILGRTLGLGFVHRWGRYFGVTEARLAVAHRWFDRIGHWALFAGYYIAGVRHFTAVIAGTSSVDFRSFAVYAYSGGLVWACLFLSIGYYFGDRWQQVIETVHRNLLYVSIGLLIAVVVYVVAKFYRRQRG